MIKFFIFYFLYANLLLLKALECDGRNINYCKKCGEGMLSDTCTQCEKKSFPLFNNLACYKCDDEKYGQVGCIGECDSSQYISTKNTICKEYKEGYYNVDGFCTKCSIGSENCIKCTYESLAPNQAKEFKCLDCLGGLKGKYRVSSDYKTCITCYVPYCLKCYFVEGEMRAECEECIPNYYVNSQGTCSLCTTKNNIKNGYCYFCPKKSVPNSDKQDCKCNSYYTLKDPYNCINCPENCYDCNYNNGKTECNNCDEGYYVNDDKTCSDCGGNCGECDKNKICNACKTGYELIDGICFKCPNNCQNCISQKHSNNELICIKCDDYYGLNSITNICLNCPSSCPNCHLNDENKLICDSCDDNYVLNNTQLCESCTNNQEIGGEGCISCKYITSSKKNRCYSCKTGYIFITNDYVCKLPSNINLNGYCEIAERIGENYSCNSCRIGNYVKITKYNEMSDCFPREGNLYNCLEAKEDENRNRQCITCINNYPLIWSDEYNQTICDNKCAFGFFFLITNNWCYECDSQMGNPGCNASLGCNYTHPNKEIDCYDCKIGYYLYKFQCMKCSLDDQYCEECHYNNTKKKRNVINVQMNFIII